MSRPINQIKRSHQQKNQVNTHKTNKLSFVDLQTRLADA